MDPHSRECLPIIWDWDETVRADAFSARTGRAERPHHRSCRDLPPLHARQQQRCASYEAVQGKSSIVPYRRRPLCLLTIMLHASWPWYPGSTQVDRAPSRARAGHEPHQAAVCRLPRGLSAHMHVTGISTVKSKLYLYWNYHPSPILSIRLNPPVHEVERTGNQRINAKVRPRDGGGTP